MFPKLQNNEHNLTSLFVEGSPFPILGGELRNSAASDLDYMKEHVWPYLRGLNLNTVVLPVSWETVEAEEDHFDFSLLQGLIGQAEKEQFKVVLLWFGLWKNGESHYVPEWVKTDRKRFFRAIYPDGTVSCTVSPFCEAAVEADRRAFSRLMCFLREQDRKQTVILVQVENEVGILGADRDYSEQANSEFTKQIPGEIRTIYDITGTWKEAFGENAEEIFMAWRYASDLERIASSGKQEYPLPMYVNAWLKQHPDRAGIYPSGGPVANLIPLWQALAPSLDMISPDIYEPLFGEVCREYAQSGNPLFIPEAARNAKSASRVFYAFGAHHAIGFCPFGIEMVKQEEDNQMSDEQLSALNIMADAMNAANTAKYLPVSYRIIEGMYPRLDEKNIGFIQEHPYDRGKLLDLENYTIQLDFLPGETGSGGIVLPEKEGFYIAGCNTRFSILPPKGTDEKVEILRYEEGEFVNGKWKRRRVLNGDERWDMQLGVTPEVRYIRLQRVKKRGNRE